MQWLVKDARPNDSLFFHCGSNFPVVKVKLKGVSDSGHGGLTKNLTGQEESGFDDGVYGDLTPGH
jgi:metacaspase-1